jgi:hypothetical protein
MPVGSHPLIPKEKQRHRKYNPQNGALNWHIKPIKKFSEALRRARPPPKDGSDRLVSKQDKNRVMDQSRSQPAGHTLNTLVDIDKTAELLGLSSIDRSLLKQIKTGDRNFQ